MNVKIFDVVNQALVDATIRIGKPSEMPSMQIGWRFNFVKHYKSRNATAYVLTAVATPNIVEGCLIFQMKDGIIPYMAFLEIAPHNQSVPRQYDFVAGCLIAFAFYQSTIQGKDDYKSLLFFNVQEQTNAGQIKLMGLYSKKYKAKKVDATTMVIIDNDGLDLCRQYLQI